jgi:transposase-like protein
MKPNEDIRKLIKQSGFCSWQVADRLGVHENTFFRWLRKELSEEDKKRIYQALEELRAEKELSQIG